MFYSCRKGRDRRGWSGQGKLQVTGRIYFGMKMEFEKEVSTGES